MVGKMSTRSKTGWAFFGNGRNWQAPVGARRAGCWHNGGTMLDVAVLQEQESEPGLRLVAEPEQGREPVVEPGPGQVLVEEPGLGLVAESGPGLVKAAGRGHGGVVNFEVDDAAPIDAVCRALGELLGRNRRLYAQGEVTVNIGRRMLRGGEQERIGQVIAAESGLEVQRFWCRREALERERERIDALLAAMEDAGDPDGSGPETAERGGAGLSDVRSHKSGSDAAGRGALGPGAMVDGRYIAGGVEHGAMRLAEPALLVRGACRAGESLRFPGDVVILGNVNPGAEVTADGDILVFGGLRGTAHAGAGGDAGAVIMAMFTASPMLRIAGYSWRAGEDEDDGGGIGIAGNGSGGGVASLRARERHNDNGRGAVIAKVAGGAIRVAPYLQGHIVNHGSVS